MNNMQTVYLIDDDPDVRKMLEMSLTMHDFNVRTFDSAEAFIDLGWSELAGCILLDVEMPGMSGLQLQQVLVEQGLSIPIIFVTGHADVPKSVEALKAGAFDFLEKPFSQQALVEIIGKAFVADQTRRSEHQQRIEHKARFDRLTEREFEIMQILIEGAANHSSKTIAERLSISPRTIEHHRMRILEKTGAHSVAELVKFASIAGFEL